MEIVVTTWRYREIDGQRVRYQEQRIITPLTQLFSHFADSTLGPIAALNKSAALAVAAQNAAGEIAKAIIRRIGNRLTVAGYTKPKDKPNREKNEHPADNPKEKHMRNPPPVPGIKPIAVVKRAIPVITAKNSPLRATPQAEKPEAKPKKSAGSRQGHLRSTRRRILREAIAAGM